MNQTTSKPFSIDINSTIINKLFIIGNKFIPSDKNSKSYLNSMKSVIRC